MAKLANMARMTVSAAPGTSTTIGLSSNVTGYLTFAQAGLLNGDIVSYAIDDSGSREVGIATYSTSGPQLTGRTVVNSTNGNALISASSAAQIFLTTLATDTYQRDNCCQFQYTSATVCTLVPYGNGNTLVIGNAIGVIPSAGITLSNSGMAATTTYWIYAYLNSGVITLEYSTTSYTTDVSTGRVIKSGDSSRRLVGKIYTTASAQFQSTANFRGTRTFLNDPGVFMSATLAGNFSYASSSWNPLVSAYAVTWNENYIMIGDWTANNTASTGSSMSIALGLNGTAYISKAYSATAGYTYAPSLTLAGNIGESIPTFSIFVYGDGTNAHTFYANQNFVNVVLRGSGY